MRTARFTAQLLVVAPTVRAWYLGLFPELQSYCTVAPVYLHSYPSGRVIKKIGQNVVPYLGEASVAVSVAPSH